MPWQKITEWARMVGAENNRRIEGRWIDLPDQLTATATGWDNEELPVVVSPDGDDSFDGVPGGGDHGGDRCMLSTEAGA